MDKLNLDIMAEGRSIGSLLSSANDSQRINNDRLIENIKILTSIITDMNSSFGITAKKLKEFSDSLEGTTKTTQEKVNGDGETTGSKPESLFSKSLGWLSKQLGGIGGKGADGKPSGLGNIPDKLNETATKIFQNDKSTAKVLEWASGLTSATSNIMKGDFVGAAMDVGKTISSIITTNRQAEKEIKKFYQELERAAIDYSIKVIAATKDIKSTQDSIFDADTANKLAKGMTGYNDAQAMLDKLYDRLSNETIQTGKKKRKFLGITTGTKTYWGDVLSNYKKILDTDKDLIDATGKLDMSVAQSLLDSGKLSTEASTTLTEMVNVQKAADEAMKQVNDTLASMSGTLGTDLQTALVSAFRDGEDAAAEFGKSVSKILENIITDQMFNIVFGDELKKLQEDMQASYSEGGDQDVTDDIAWFYTAYTAGVEQFNKGLSQMKEQVGGMTGLDLFGSTKAQTQSSSKGYSVSMDQDTGGAILGRVTGLHETGLRLENGLNTMLGIQAEKNNLFVEQSNQLLQLCSVNVQSMYHLEDINKNTKQLYQINDRLGTIEQHTSRL